MRYILKVGDLKRELDKIPDEDCIMINMGGHVENDYPITHIEDSQSIGFWELRCDPSVDFWDALEKAYKNNEM